MTAHNLIKLLAARHADAVFVPECKMGAAGSRTLDAWALLPTWSPLTAIGYETKVSRSDWLQDQKYEEYRAVCHLFFVVAPKGIVARAELPAGVGLLEPVGEGTGRRLVMRVKPVRQEPDPAKLSRLMAYALMWRVGRQPQDETERRAGRAARWARWVAEREDFRMIASAVRGRMRLLLTEAIDARRAAERRAAALTEADELMRALNVRPDCWSIRREMERKLAEAGHVRRALEQAQQAVSRALATLDDAEAAQEVSA